MRGTLSRSILLVEAAGIIPAYAGNTSIMHPIMHPWRDHPRVCGEHPKEHVGADMQEGSSPRMRGTQACLVINERIHGIIPAYAGNTQCVTLPRLAVWDHPRVCGEHFCHLPFLAGRLGSSPRMRGTPYDPPYHPASRGIIPAYAGNTQQGVSKRARLRDHPRVCGEHSTCELPSLKAQGSSPRMRGTL